MTNLTKKIVCFRRVFVITEFIITVHVITTFVLTKFHSSLKKYGDQNLHLVKNRKLRKIVKEKEGRLLPNL
jgi:hypothetical protein